MGFCSPVCQKWTTFSVGSLLMIVGILIVLFWSVVIQTILNNELSLKNNKTYNFKMWKETPIPLYSEFFLFNWTNAEEVEKNWTIKPILVEIGPYTYSEHHSRVEIQYHDNDKISYETVRTFKYLPERSVGSLEDTVIALNPILVTIGYFARFKSTLFQMAINFLLDEFKYNLTVTKTVGELLFDGYEDPMIDLVHKLNISGIDIPFDKFAWFYSRNGSATYDGMFTMYNGADSLRKLGKFTAWNGVSQTKYYPSYCGKVNGTSGELWYPVQDDETVQVFSPDLCSTLTLVKDKKYSLEGLEGIIFVADERNFDNGTKYPDMKCFSPFNTIPSGTRNISLCKFLAPAFVSFPHFYLADAYYSEAVEGMSPNKTAHEFNVIIEPTTGMPLKVQATVQVNLYIPQVKGISLLKHVKPIYMPVLWFRQTAKLTKSLATQGKVLLVLPSVGYYTGYGIIAIGILLFIIGIYVTIKKGWVEPTYDEQQLLHQ